MKRIGITAMVIGCILGFSAVAAGSAAASFSLCLQVDIKATGTYESSGCGKEKTKGEYILATVSKKLSTGVWCAKLDNGSTKGNYETSECTTEVAEKGAYTKVKVTKGEEEKKEEEEEKPVEFNPAEGQTITGESDIPNWENGLLWDVACEKGTHGGEVLNRHTASRIVIKFTGCLLKKEGKTCTAKSDGAASGEIATRTLKGLLGTVKKTEAGSGIGLLLLPEESASTSFFEIEEDACIAYPEGRAYGSVAGEVLPIGEKTEHLSLKIEGTKIKTISVLGGLLKPRLMGYLETAESALVIDNLIVSGGTEVT